MKQTTAGTPDISRPGEARARTIPERLFLTLVPTWFQLIMLNSDRLCWVAWRRCCGNVDFYVTRLAPPFFDSNPPPLFSQIGATVGMYGSYTFYELQEFLTGPSSTYVLGHSVLRGKRYLCPYKGFRNYDSYLKRGNGWVDTMTSLCVLLSLKVVSYNWQLAMVALSIENSRCKAIFWNKTFLDGRLFVTAFVTSNDMRSKGLPSHWLKHAHPGTIYIVKFCKLQLDFWFGI